MNESAMLSFGDLVLEIPATLFPSSGQRSVMNIIIQGGELAHKFESLYSVADFRESLDLSHDALDSLKPWQLPPKHRISGNALRKTMCLGTFRST